MLRALIVDSCDAQAALVGSRTLASDGRYAIDARPQPSSLPERRACAERLGRTWEVLARASGLAGSVPEAFVTRSAAAQIGVGETAFPPLAIVAIVAVAVVGVAYCAHQAAQVIDRQLSRSEDSVRLLQADEAARAAVAAHAEAERAAGRTLPLSAAQHELFDLLKQRQDAIAKKLEPPLSSGVPGMPSIAGGATGALVVLGALAVGWYALRGRSAA